MVDVSSKGVEKLRVLLSKSNRHYMQHHAYRDADQGMEPKEESCSEGAIQYGEFPWSSS